MKLAGKISFYLCLQIVLLISILLNPTFAQKCYKKTIHPSEKAFNRTLYYPQYKGKEKELSFFIAKSIDFGVVAAIQNAEQEWQDSVGVRFVIGKDGKMSDLIIDSNHSDLANEVLKAFKKTACNWKPGGTERILNVWYACIVYVKIEKRGNMFVYSVSITPRNPFV